MNIICYKDFKNKTKVIRKARDILGTDQYFWVYFGSDYQVFKNIESLFGNNTRLKLGSAFHVIAKEIKPKYLEYISRLSKSNQFSVLWWASGMASKSPFMSQFFKLFCYRELIFKLARERHNLIIFIEDPFLFEMIRKSFSREKVIFLGNTRLFLIRLFVRASFKRLRVLIGMLILKLMIRATSGPNLSSTNTLLFSWINPGSFRGDGLFIDHYLGGLKSYLDQNEKKTSRLTFSFFFRQQVNEIKKANETFVMPLKYLSWWQIIASAGTIFRFKYYDFCRFEGVDVSRLLQREIFQENEHGEFIKHLAFYSGLRKIFKIASNLQAVFHPFEGQPWEKMLSLAAKTVNPKIKLFGYQHSSFSPFDMNYHFGLNEIEFNPLPDLVLTNSEYNRKRLIVSGFSENKVSSIGSLRYPYVFEPNNISESTRGIESSILICLPYSYEIALEMLLDIIPALIKFKNMNTLAKIRIKPHPLVPFDFSMLENSEKIMPAIELVSGKLENLLMESDILLYCNGTVSIEGVYADKKLIKYLPELELDLDPLALAEEDYLIRVCTRGEIDKIILDVISSGNMPTGRKKNMFDPVDYGKIDKLLREK